MSLQMLRYGIIESIKLLASEGNVQLSCYPDFVCKGDEIANVLCDWLLLYQEKIKEDTEFAFLADELKLIVDLDRDISLLSFEDFSDSSIMNSDKWEFIRRQANNVLTYLGETYSYPDKKYI